MHRMTKQKKMLYQAVKSFNSFFDCYALQDKLNQKGRKPGLATIYRFLSRLEADGELHSFFCNNKKIYSNDKTSHIHFKCEKCGKIKHVEIKNLAFLKEFVNETICHFQIELTGVCKDCKR